MKTRVFEPERLTPAVEERFWAKTLPTPGGCLRWTGYLNREGYGRFYVPGWGAVPSHRVAVVLATGAPIPSGLDVDHLCRRTWCVKPQHLEAVERRVNLYRGTAPSSKSARGVECPKGHDLTAPNAWAVESSGARRCRLCRNETARRVQRRRRSNT